MITKENLGFELCMFFSMEEITSKILNICLEAQALNINFERHASEHVTGRKVYPSNSQAHILSDWEVIGKSVFKYFVQGLSMSVMLRLIGQKSMQCS